MRNLFIYISVLLIAAGTSLEAPAQLSGVFYKVKFGDTLAAARQKLEKECGSTDLVVVKKPVYPLAKNSEKHLVCEEIKIGDDVIGEVVFSFGDDHLSLIEARGGAVKALLSRASGESVSLANYKAYFSDLMVAETSKDAVWLLSPESAHPNLFAWSNPYLPSNKGAKKTYQRSAKIPGLLKFGADIKLLMPLFEKQCPLLQVEEIKEPSLPSKPKKQTQLNCFGFEYAGFPRKIEAVFGDGVLELAWILTGKGEEDRVRRALIKEYGKPESTSDSWESFKGWQIALRKDKPEVLLLSEKMVPFMKKYYQ
ncbi:MAG: hypothetical protein KDB79_12225 [Acidobacteria bacterium]|nr:hypothetical protein [Acidobacteriota bacterium]